jgi:HEPN domain-containing protein
MATNRTQHMANVAELPGDLLSALLSVIQPEKVLCFGIRSENREAWSCFIPGPEIQALTIYDLLILTRSCEKRSKHELLDMIERLKSPGWKVNALIHNIYTVNEALAAGNTFFAAIYKKGLLVYDQVTTPLVEPVERELMKDTPKEDLWRRFFGLAQQFLKGASDFSSRGWNGLAAFMLHQSLEHTCIALIRVVAGYRPITHNLGRLITMTENFAPFSAPVFPRNTKEEVDLFHLLATAYSDVRYKDNHNVSAAQVNILIERVSIFQRQAETLLRKQFANTRIPSSVLRELEP